MGLLTFFSKKKDESLECAGDLQGCSCCPEEPPECSADDCVGDDQLLCTEPRYAVCDCEMGGEGEPSNAYEADDAPSDEDLAGTADDVVGKYWGGDVANIPGYDAGAGEEEPEEEPVEEEPIEDEEPTEEE